MFKAKVNNQEFEIQPTGDGFNVDGKLLTWDLVRLSQGHFHIVHNNKSYRAEIVKTDEASKTVTVKINGKRHVVELKNKMDLLLEKMGLEAGVSNKINSIKAPMPGLIIDLKVKEGDIVKQNDVLLILEAMKMENIIKSPGEGEVKSVKVTKGQSVEKSQVLIEFKS